jgi:predicted NBD/HSP70 family sugar kinase
MAVVRPDNPQQARLLRLLRDDGPRSRAELGDAVELSRSRLAVELDRLVALGLVETAGLAASRGGRRSSMVQIARNARFLGIDIGATSIDVAVTDGELRVLSHASEPMDVRQGPEAVIGRALEMVGKLRAADTAPGFAGAGAGVPGPVSFAEGLPVSPPIMPGWNHFPVRETFAAELGCPVLVDNDVNIMALGEYWSRWRDTQHLLFVKVGTGIGCGIISDGRIHRGAQGAAGDIGHIHVPDHDDVICRCGNLGCLEAIAGGGAMAAKLTELGVTAHNSRDVVKHVRDGRPEAMRLVRQAGRELGGVLASAVNFFNPGVIVIGGDIAHADEHLLAGVREVVYRRSTALATRSIRIARSTLDDRAGVIGAAVMVIEAVLAPDAVDQAIAAATA